ncbi:MAG: hypothetical protein QOF61_269 [Acidobacteriota bacterium]|jgi:hypothetical protein|nr:hypothetical protein [Acidobacteriota bacterium]
MRKCRPVKSFISRLARGERGSQLVEAAIVLPVMFMLLAGISEFGNFFYQYSTLTTACRAGARHACKWRRDASWVFPETSSLVVYGDYTDTSKGPILPGLAPANVSIVANGPSVNNIDSVTVSIINYKYQPLFDLGKLTGIPSLSMKIPINATATMHQLFNGPTSGE